MKVILEGSAKEIAALIEEVKKSQHSTTTVSLVQKHPVNLHTIPELMVGTLPQPRGAP